MNEAARATWGKAILLVCAMLGSEALYLALVKFHATNGARPVLMFLGIIAALFAMYGVAGWAVKRNCLPRTMLFVILAGATGFRLTLLPAGLPHEHTWREMANDFERDVRGEAVSYERFLLYDHDLWRYLWDGHVAAQGVNPFAFAPLDERLDRLAEEDVWSQIRDNINHADVPTIYPPLAQFVFRLAHALAPGSVLVMKSWIVFFDGLAILFLALTLRLYARPLTDIIWYAWNPLVIKVFAGSGHIDAVLVAALAALAYFTARQQRAATGITFGLAILAKLSPLVLLPFVVKRMGWRWSLATAAVVLAGFAPFLNAGATLFAGLSAFAEDWQFNAGVYALLQWLTAPVVARVLGGAIIIGIIAWLVWRDDGSDASFARLSVVALGALLLLSPAVMPWYVTWLLPLAILARQPLWLIFSALVCLSFLVLIDETERSWVLWLEYSLLLLAGVWLVRQNLRFTHNFWEDKQ
jgi:hypothetical protein